MLLLKGESPDVVNYCSREKLIYDFYVKHIEDINIEIDSVKKQIKDLNKLGFIDTDEKIKDLKRLRQRLRYRLNKEYDFLFKHMGRLDKEDEERIWKDLKNKNILWFDGNVLTNVFTFVIIYMWFDDN